ncbi:MAG: hypothetical protein A3I38_01290 [Candidatus Wildermuthbacteria bacterium RIFCSPLOWO2_02_FULL_47_10]|uniref:HTH deoR-type domain-containing protein n=2 Tax=Candidatus Wildermuthiibacteriota TaxID=1817923 RepID=A0A1G2RN14_9BACT|nr:MAG: hypothetical protein UY15_C0020G0015 [Parcubacteria group bacterium GW2011_GWA2_47_9]OHA68858.1 MAG: hypothetical protein A3D59_00265 [Candidatus Wildermuthbacteria bacterium RIFCSPHIGHO2_02_FULL_47_17]OHA74216.1 MAG: hypothetical protein A3A32_02485 [Candidatus Wildermuthbacteria bacterium RIFCSPLOWO2_01_FULL_48_35]OHA75398.1 MAG: hypothetical protein A3I38_01290 [Candidatus Wildermuthbacteria bacterium RIFCSPLOWO2_02_FULL_47_10]
MDRDHLLKLTMAVYRVTNLFPKKEPLGYDIREAANRILACGLAGEDARGDLELLKTYFDIAKTQNWVSEKNFLILVQEYDKLNEQNEVLPDIMSLPTVEKLRKSGRAPEKPRKANGSDYSSPRVRKKKITEVIHKEEKIALRDLIRGFPDINRRTLIRDLENLVRESAIKKEGNGKKALYLPNGHKVLLIPQVYAKSDGQEEMVTEA